jgi:hypothetical protein
LSRKPENQKTVKYLTTENAKTTKGESLGYLTAILYLAPSALSGRNVCSHASEGCIASCLNLAGMGAFGNVQDARVNKTRAFFANPRAFIEQLAEDIEAAERKARREGLDLCVRLNGTSDLPWENLGGEAGVCLMRRFPHIRFYDYTKNPARARAFLAGRLPANYSLTFSRSECNGETALELARAGANVAVVFACKREDALPAKWAGRKVIDGDLHDLRFLDGRGRVVGLRAKGPARKDESGFVVREGGAA